MINNKNRQKGITLIALVVTIIVLLILAGISIQMLTGNNGIIQRTMEEKKVTGIAEIEEEIRLEYLALLSNDKVTGSNNLSIENAIKNVQSKPQYQDKIEKKSRSGEKILKLSNESIIVGKTAPDNTATITIDIDGDYYAVVDGKYYKIPIDSKNIEIEKMSTDFEGSDSGSNSTSITEPTGVSVENGTGSATASYDSNTKKITITGVEVGTSTLKVTGTSLSASIEVVNSIVDVDLDGAIIPGTIGNGAGNTNLSFTSDKITQGDESIATVTSEGVIKCGSKTGTTTVKIDDTGYKVISTANIASKIGNGAPDVPTGFTPIDTNDAKWYNEETKNAETDNGLVIMDEKGSQFVWVPVTNLNDMFMCKKHSATSDCDIHLTSDGTGIECRSEAHKETNGNYCIEIVGKLYAILGGENFGTVNQTYTQNNEFREPDIINSTIYGDWSTTADKGLNLITRYITEYIGKNIYTETATIKSGWTNQLKTEFNKMAISVAKNGGFYFGRYEASLINGETRVIAGATSMSAETTSAGTWYGLYQKQKDFISDGTLKSTMIWGSQYDRVMNWINDDTKIKDNSGTNKNSDSKRRTGVVSTDKLKNIFDLYGLRRECTIEAYLTSYRVLRGGHYSIYDSPSYRNNVSPNYTNVFYGSRPSLYID